VNNEGKVSRNANQNMCPLKNKKQVFAYNQDIGMNIPYSFEG